MEETDDKFWMTTNRIETLVDGIFAIAMTLLVLNLVVPDISGPLSETVVLNSLMNVGPKFYVFVLSFVLLAVFWTIHHKSFHIIKKADSALLWINIIWLLFIVMVPFSNTLTGDYGNFVISHLIFNLNMLGISVFIFLSWYYAVKKGLIDKNVSSKVKSGITNGCLIFICITLLAILLSFIAPGWSSLAYVLIIPFEIIAGRL